MPYVLAIGSHPSEFLTHLEAAGYTYTTVKTYSESNLNPDEALVAVAVYGSDVGLESTQAILSLLETNTILLLFSPSLILLQVLKNAIGTVIDLPEIKLEDNVPLIVYKMRGIDRFHIVPGFAISKSEQQSTESSQSNLLALSVKLIEECITRASDPIALHRLPLEDSLIPSPGTVWWSHSTGFSLVNRHFQSDLFLWWSVDLYTYATGHTPIPNKDFAKNGGVVYTVMKHNGSFRYEGSGSLVFLGGSTSIGNPGGLLHYDYQSPAGWSSVQDETYFYDITFSKTVTLFKDQGETAYNHALRYGYPYTLENVKETSSSPDGQTSKFEFKSSELPFGHTWSTMPIHGLSVWRSDVGKAKMDCKYEFEVGHLVPWPRVSVSGSKELPLDVTFGGA